jgi:hypothetical protein
MSGIGGVGSTGGLSAYDGTSGVSHADIASFGNASLEALGAEVDGQLGDGALGHEETVMRLEVSVPDGVSWEDAVEKVLVEHYMDDMKAVARDATPADIDHVVANLDYLKTGTADAQARLGVVRNALTAHAGDPALKLYALDSQGYGSFGEGNGFALVDTSTGQAFIAVSGYAE